MWERRETLRTSPKRHAMKRKHNNRIRFVLYQGYHSLMLLQPYMQAMHMCVMQKKTLLSVGIHPPSRASSSRALSISTASTWVESRLAFFLSLSGVCMTLWTFGLEAVGATPHFPLIHPPSFLPKVAFGFPGCEFDVLPSLEAFASSSRL